MEEIKYVGSHGIKYSFVQKYFAGFDFQLKTKITVLYGNLLIYSKS